MAFHRSLNAEFDKNFVQKLSHRLENADRLTVQTPRSSNHPQK